MKTLVVIPGARTGWSMWVGERSPHVVAGGVVKAGLREVRALLKQFNPTRLVVQDSTSLLKPDSTKLQADAYYWNKHSWTIPAEYNECRVVERQPNFSKAVVEKRMHIKCETVEEKLAAAKAIKETLGTSEKVKEALPDELESEAILLGYAIAFDE